MRRGHSTRATITDTHYENVQRSQSGRKGDNDLINWDTPLCAKNKPINLQYRNVSTSWGVLFKPKGAIFAFNIIQITKLSADKRAAPPGLVTCCSEWLLHYNIHKLFC